MRLSTEKRNISMQKFDFYAEVGPLDICVSNFPQGRICMRHTRHGGSPSGLTDSKLKAADKKFLIQYN